MPIFVSNYYWEQSTTDVRISVPVKNVVSSKMRLFTNDKFIKLNFSSCIFELALNAAVVPSKTKCIVKKDEVVFELVKQRPEMWNSLQQPLGKQQLIEAKKNIINREQLNAAERMKEKEKQMNEQKRLLHDYQMSVIMEEKEKILLLKEQQKANAEEGLAAWKKDIKQTDLKFHSTKDEGCIKLHRYTSIPFPRKDGVITFSYSPRLFPTPKRESKSAEEEEWLKKEVEAKRAIGFVPEDLTEEERDPTWLLSKGKSFFDNENFQGAFYAFQYGSKIAPKLPIFYVKLAHTCLKLNRFPWAIENATRALKLLTPVCKDNKQLRAEAYNVRAEAYKAIGETILCDSDLSVSSSLLK